MSAINRIERVAVDIKDGRVAPKFLLHGEIVKG